MNVAEGLRVLVHRGVGAAAGLEHLEDAFGEAARREVARVRDGLDRRGGLDI
jgi:hypothetical protein